MHEARTYRRGCDLAARMHSIRLSVYEALTYRRDCDTETSRSRVFIFCARNPDLQKGLRRVVRTDYAVSYAHEALIYRRDWNSSVGGPPSGRVMVREALTFRRDCDAWTSALTLKIPVHEALTYRGIATSQDFGQSVARNRVHEALTYRRDCDPPMPSRSGGACVHKALTYRRDCDLEQELLVFLLVTCTKP